MWNNKLDLSSTLAIFATILLLYLGITYNGNSIIPFIDMPSVIIVILGTFMATIGCYGWAEIAKTPKIIKHGITSKAPHLPDVLTTILKLAELVHRKGHLSIQQEVVKMKSDPILKEMCELLLDDAGAEFIERNLKQRMVALSESRGKVIEIIRKAAEIAPSMGLIGTLIGLVQMLGALDNLNKIGPSMAVALLTTFYGAVMAYVLLNPMASKLEYVTKNELLVSRIYLEAGLSMSRKENPRKLQMIINSLLPTDKQIFYFQ